MKKEFGHLVAAFQNIDNEACRASLQKNITFEEECHLKVIKKIGGRFLKRDRFASIRKRFSYSRWHL